MFRYSFKILPVRLKLIWLPCESLGQRISFVFGARVSHFAATPQSDVGGVWSCDLGVMATLSVQQKMPFFVCIYNPQITVSPTSLFSASFNSFIPENRYSGWENLSLHSREPLERGRHKHSLPSSWPLQRFCLWNPRLSVTWSAPQFPLASVTGPEECFDKPHNALISRAWPLPDCGKVSSAQNLSISRDGVRVFCTVGKMAGDEYNDSDWFSDDDVYDNLGENDFDLFELTEEETAELANAFKDDSESGDELDDENLPLFFTQPHFKWTGGGHCCDTRHTSDVQCRCVQRHSKYSCTELQWKHCVYIW